MLDVMSSHEDWHVSPGSVTESEGRRVWSEGVWFCFSPRPATDEREANRYLAENATWAILHRRERWVVRIETAPCTANCNNMHTKIRNFFTLAGPLQAHVGAPMAMATLPVAENSASRLHTERLRI
jgi:hypothetical protein